MGKKKFNVMPDFHVYITRQQLKYKKKSTSVKKKKYTNLLLKPFCLFLHCKNTKSLPRNKKAAQTMRKKYIDNK